MRQSLIRYSSRFTFRFCRNKSEMAGNRGRKSGEKWPGCRCFSRCRACRTDSGLELICPAPAVNKKIRSSGEKVVSTSRAFCSAV